MTILNCSQQYTRYEKENMSNKTLVIDIGGTFIKYGLIDYNCRLDFVEKIKTPYGSKEIILETLKNIYLKFRNQVEGLALSVPGFVDSKQGLLVKAGFIRELDGVFLEKELSQICDLKPVSIENDGKAAALCEAWKGAAQNTHSSISLIFGTGIGGGVILNDKIMRGHHLTAGEFSFLMSNFDDSNYFGFIAQKYSTIAIVERIQKELKVDRFNGEMMMNLYRENHPVVKQIVDEWIVFITKFCYDLELLYNPEVICIGGGISGDDLFIKLICNGIDQLSEKILHMYKPHVTRCHFQNDSNLIGAYYTYCQKYK